MIYLPQASYPVWKQRLRDGAIEPEFAAQVGRRLAHIHARSAHDPVLAEAFANEATFAQIRLDPYLRASAQRHPDLAARLHQLADSTGRIKRALVHGDVSPKNILCGPRDPVFIDAECACYGDPAFDLAFCLNHLLLKGLWKPHWRMDYLHCFNALTAAYLAAVDWEPPAALESRCAALLPGLLLARVDGKSPVEYIDRESQRRRVRAVARQLLIAPAARLNSISALWGDRHG
jgi:Ser/Thr protein kinase RdoA (MazF antagonist)